MLSNNNSDQNNPITHNTIQQEQQTLLTVHAARQSHWAKQNTLKKPIIVATISTIKQKHHAYI